MGIKTQNKCFLILKCVQKKLKIRHVLSSGHQSTYRSCPPPPLTLLLGKTLIRAGPLAFGYCLMQTRHITHSTLEIKDRRPEGSAYRMTL